MAAKLEQNKDVAYLSYQLATIKTDVELELTCEELEVQPPAADDLLALFRQYEFKRWTTDVEAGKWLQAKGANRLRNLHYLQQRQKRKKRLKPLLHFQQSIMSLSLMRLRCSRIDKLKQAPLFAFDTETDSWITSPPTWLVFHSLLSQAWPPMSR